MDSLRRAYRKAEMQTMLNQKERQKQLKMIEFKLLVPPVFHAYCDDAPETKIYEQLKRN